MTPEIRLRLRIVTRSTRVPDTQRPTTGHRPGTDTSDNSSALKFDHQWKELEAQRKVKSRKASSTFFSRLDGTVQ